MPRIAGVDIPADKPIRISLRYIYGVGPTNSDAILKEAGKTGCNGSRRCLQAWNYSRAGFSSAPDE